MNEKLRAAIERCIGSATERSARVASSRAVGGGCINQTSMVTLEDGRQFFLKTNDGAPLDMFPAEAEGLAALRTVEALRVPAPIALGGGADGVAPFLVLEPIASGRRAHDHSERLGSGLAVLHRQARQTRFGFARDNYLGSTPQPNGWRDDWVAFWREQRLGHQLALARANALCDGPMSALGDRLLDRLDALIAEPVDPPSLLHGDLWGGNVMSDERGAPVLIDPACYYGRREAELAMTRLFGGFDQRFYDAYDETWSLEPGWEERLEIYELYHLLNHLNLFGGSYRGSCLRILQRFAG